MLGHIGQRVYAGLFKNLPPIDILELSILSGLASDRSLTQVIGLHKLAALATRNNNDI